ncbi:hypothetical protein DF043_36250 [Burkholderia cepacia]|uniref:hypothetical protein n=1 Tax=Burkholderia cepacia TaxID=292 RepID=UPI000F5A58E2|nr:hypothetical protein [Burkholderia cepacia]RQT47344.1 hypothetical protein DF043_36250 [Burkholderia cepacia]
MDLKFSSEVLDRLEVDAGFDHSLPSSAVRAYRKRLAILRAIVGGEDLRAMRSLSTHAHDAQHRVALDENFVLEFEVVDHGTAVMIVAIISVETEMSI